MTDIEKIYAQYRSIELTPFYDDLTSVIAESGEDLLLSLCEATLEGPLLYRSDFGCIIGSKTLPIKSVKRDDLSHAARAEYDKIINRVDVMARKIVLSALSLDTGMEMEKESFLEFLGEKDAEMGLVGSKSALNIYINETSRMYEEWEYSEIIRVSLNRGDIKKGHRDRILEVAFSRSFHKKSESPEISDKLSSFCVIKSVQDKDGEKILSTIVKAIQEFKN